MNVFIIGGTGYLGTYLYKELVLKGHSVRYTGRKESANPHSIQCDIITDDITIPANTDVVFYLSQAENYADFPNSVATILGVNTFGAVKAAHAAQQAGCKAFFYASTGNVYAPSYNAQAEHNPRDRSTPYAVSKVQAEEWLSMLNGTAMPICNFRVFGLYGARQTKRLAATLLKNIHDGNPISLSPTQEEITHNNGETTGGLRLSWLYVRDAATQLTQLAQTVLEEGKAPLFLNLAGDKPLSLRELTGYMGEALKRPVHYTIQQQPRNCDFIAEVGLLKSLIQPTYTSPKEAVTDLVRNAYPELMPE